MPRLVDVSSTTAAIIVIFLECWLSIPANWELIPALAGRTTQEPLCREGQCWESIHAGTPDCRSCDLRCHLRSFSCSPSKRGESNNSAHPLHCCMGHKRLKDVTQGRPALRWHRKPFYPVLQLRQWNLSFLYLPSIHPSSFPLCSVFPGPGPMDYISQTLLHLVFCKFSQWEVLVGDWHLGGRNQPGWGSLQPPLSQQWLYPP